MVGDAIRKVRPRQVSRLFVTVTCDRGADLLFVIIVVQSSEDNDIRYHPTADGDT